MVAIVISGIPFGMGGEILHVEVDVGKGLPSFSVVGLPAAAVQEARARVRPALVNGGFDFPPRRITVNLSPADIRKEGTHLDLPIAVGILAAAREDLPMALKDIALVGELSLDGQLKPVEGILSLAAGLREKGIAKILLPEENAAQAALVEGLECYPAKNLTQAVHFLMGRCRISPLAGEGKEKERFRATAFDFSMINGQKEAIRLLTIAAAGFHSFLLTGPPGSGKSLLIRCLPSILPDLTFSQQQEVGNLYSLAGMSREREPFSKRPPFRSPHHTCSATALVGGGARPRPGEVSLAHRGVLFLDEAPEFQRSAIEALRQPVEEGRVTIAREKATLTFPCRFLLAAARNPCPCGMLGQPGDVCRCTASQIRRYRERLSRAITDRIDLFLDVDTDRRAFLLPAEKEKEQEEKRIRSADLRVLVEEARGRQKERYKREGLYNGFLMPEEVEAFCRPEPGARDLLLQAAKTFSMSGRAIHRLMKVARTIADLQGRELTEEAHVAEALQYRERRQEE